MEETIIITAMVDGRVEEFTLAQADAIHLPITLSMLTRQPPFLVRVKDRSSRDAVISTAVILSARERGY